MLAAICICSFWTESQISSSFVNYKKVDMPNSITQGRHLLGYCYLNLGEVERALREFKRCIKGMYCHRRVVCKTCWTDSTWHRGLWWRLAIGGRTHHRSGTKKTKSSCWIGGWWSPIWSGGGDLLGHPGKFEWWLKAWKSADFNAFFNIKKRLELNSNIFLFNLFCRELQEGKCSCPPGNCLSG